jgi:hypothetical protein
MEELLGENISDSVWKYTQREEVEEGAMLCKAGEYNDKLYVLQSGRLTSYSDYSEKARGIRLYTMMRGACVNEESLFLNVPSAITIVADVPSVVISISAQAWALMEANDPEVALQIQRTVLLHAATMRNRLQVPPITPFLSLSVSLFLFLVFPLSVLLPLSLPLPPHTSPHCRKSVTCCRTTTSTTTTTSTPATADSARPSWLRRS